MTSYDGERVLDRVAVERVPARRITVVHRAKNGLGRFVNPLRILYSSWRDTKTAILVFNKNKDTSNVLDEIKAASEEHQHYKRSLNWKHESGFRFVMHHPADTNRELTMTVLVFDIPQFEKASKAARPAKAATKKRGTD